MTGLQKLRFAAMTTGRLWLSWASYRDLSAELGRELPAEPPAGYEGQAIILDEHGAYFEGDADEVRG